MKLRNIGEAVASVFSRKHHNRKTEADLRERSEWPPYKGTEEPWKKPGQASQDPNATDADIDLERWQRTNTH